MYCGRTLGLKKILHLAFLLFIRWPLPISVTFLGLSCFVYKMEGLDSSSWIGQTAAHGPNPAYLLCVWIKFYWNKATLICLLIVCSCFCTITRELSSLQQRSYGLKSLKYSPFGHLQKKFANSCSRWSRSKVPFNNNYVILTHVK